MYWIIYQIIHITLSSTRDGVDVFIGFKEDGSPVAAKQCIRRSVLQLTQILGPTNKSNLVRVLVSA